jgi:hypothetical protein
VEVAPLNADPTFIVGERARKNFVPDRLIEMEGKFIA